MLHRGLGRVGCRLLVAAIAAMPLAACGSSDFVGASVFGSNKLKDPDLAAAGATTADAALTEARAHFRNNDFGYSAALYKRAVELAPGSIEAYVGLGASYDQLRRFDLADRVYASLFKLTGATAQYYNNLGYSHLLRGDVKTAIANLRKAKQLDPQNVVIANNLEMISDLAKGKTSPRA